MRRAAFAAAAIMLVAACATKNTQNQFLGEVGSLSKEEIMARGDAIAAKKKWQDARKYYSFLADSVPNDPLGRQAALKVADTFYDEGDTESLTEAQLRYKDFSNRFPRGGMQKLSVSCSRLRGYRFSAYLSYYLFMDYTSTD